MPFHRFVLLLLAAPIIGVGVVLWFLLPGSLGGMSYLPSEYNHEVQLSPAYWTAHDATVRGYLRVVPCSHADCANMVLSDKPHGLRAGQPPDPQSDIVLLPQHESKWHSVLRSILPQVVAKPIGPLDDNRLIKVTGRLRAGFSPGHVPVMQPSSL